MGHVGILKIGIQPICSYLHDDAVRSRQAALYSRLSYVTVNTKVIGILTYSSEIGNTVGYEYTLKNGLQLPGSRISTFDVDKQTLQVVNAGLSFDTIINREGKEVKVATDLENAGLNRFCFPN